MNGLDYYSAAAQVIPLLFIVLVFQMRYFELPEGAVPRWLARLARLIDYGFIALAVAGEVAAFYALQSGHGTELTRRLTESAMLALGTGIAWLTLRGQPGLLRRLERLEQIEALHSALQTRERIDGIREDVQELLEKVERRDDDEDDDDRDDDDRD